MLGFVLVPENIEKNVFDRKEPFFGKLETFLQHILEYRKKLFSAEKYFFVTDLGGLLLSIVELHVEHPKWSCRTPQAKIVRIVEQIGRIVEHFRDPTSRIVDFGES